MKSIFQPISDYLRKINWVLLLFLLLVLNVKMVIKIGAIILLVLINRKILLERSVYRQRFIWFYVSMIIIAGSNLALNPGSLSVNYLVLVSVGTAFWAMCIMAALINSWLVHRTDIARLHQTISLFFILNMIVTFIQLLLIVMDAGSINPYTYQGMHQKYYVGTGDWMTGLTFDVSTTNALLNAFGVVYYLQRNKMNMTLLCMAAALVTASNFTNIWMILVLLILFVFQSSLNQKSIIVVCLGMLAIFTIKISPQNNHYVTEAFKKMFPKEETSIVERPAIIPPKPDTAMQEKKETATKVADSINKTRAQELVRKGIPLDSFIKPSIPQDNIHSEPFQRDRDTTSFQRELIAFESHRVPKGNPAISNNTRLPGKIIALRQTLFYFQEHPMKTFTGAGMGNFASKLAFRATGLGMAGGYPKKFAYINSDFMSNHLHLYINFFSMDKEFHSLINSPNSVYDQLVAEYGMAGVLAFIIFYLGFFVKKLRKRSYGLPLLLILLGAFWTDYWYEQLSIVIFFELLMLINIKENSTANE